MPAPSAPAPGIVTTQAQIMWRVTPQRTAERRWDAPTPRIAPVIVCVVLTGMPTVFLILAFEFSNGWDYAANSIGMVGSTPVLTPFRAVLWASFWNFTAAFVFGPAVPNTTGRGLCRK